MRKIQNSKMYKFIIWLYELHINAGYTHSETMHIILDIYELPRGWVGASILKYRMINEQ